MPVWLAVAGLGCLAALRSAGYVTWAAALAFIAASFLVELRNIAWVAMTYELAPAYASATPDVQSALAAVGDTLNRFVYIAGDLMAGILFGGVGVPLVSWAMLRSELAPRWVCWLGFAVAITAGWGTLLLPLGGVFAIAVLDRLALVHRLDGLCGDPPLARARARDHLTWGGR